MWWLPLHPRGTNDQRKDTNHVLGIVVDDDSRWVRACVSQLFGLLRRLQVLRTATLAIRPLRRLRVSFVCGFEVVLRTAKCRV